MKPFWKQPITAEDRKPHACLNCELNGAKPLTFGADNIIAVGFGSATLTKDGQLVYEEPRLDYDDDGVPKEGPEPDYMTGATALALAKSEPERDWIIDLQGPMSGRTYQFQGDAGFVMIDQNEGFA